jgi:hypothetical protein
MDGTLDEQADRTYAALIGHLDRCIVCPAAGGSTTLMCEHGHLLAVCWEVAEYRANMGASAEAPISAD